MSTPLQEQQQIEPSQKYTQGTTLPLGVGRNLHHEWANEHPTGNVQYPLQGIREIHEILQFLE